MTDPTSDSNPRRLIAASNGQPTAREVVDAHLLAIDLAELSGRGDLAAVDRLMPTRKADLRLLVGAQATLVADFAAIAAGSKHQTVLADLFDRLRLRVLTAEQPA